MASNTLTDEDISSTTIPESQPDSSSNDFKSSSQSTPTTSTNKSKNTYSYQFNINHEMFASNLRDFVELKKQEFGTLVNAQLTTLTEEYIQKTMAGLPGAVRTSDDNDSTNGFRDEKGDSSRRRRRSGDYRQGDAMLPKKVFRHRQSVLTDLLTISHIRTVYHIFVAILIIFSLNTMVSDWATYGGIIHTYHLELISWAFGKTKDVIMIWLMMQMTTIMIVYPAYIQWSNNRPTPCHQATLYDYFWLIMLIIYQITFLILPLKLIYVHHLPPASSVIIVAEQIRMLMKSHAFIRENVPKVIYNKPKCNEYDDELDDDDGDSDIPCPNFSHYLYFLFAPTLVYSNNYPRTPSIRWRYVVSNFSQVFFCIVYMYYVFARFCFVNFSNFNSEHVTLEQFMISAFGCMLPGGLVLLICFFAVLHSWLNAFAEMLRFGDRLFYKDWWTATSFGTYYRTWNVVVHDWLYTYVYREVYRLVKGPAKRAVATATVFLISAVFHEYVLIVSFRFFYPVLFFMFGGAGFGFIFIKGHSRYWNVALWVALFSGTGILMCLYSVEWYARRNCPVSYDSFADYLVPRSWFCRGHSKFTPHK